MVGGGNSDDDIEEQRVWTTRMARRAAASRCSARPRCQQRLQPDRSVLASAPVASPFLIQITGQHVQFVLQIYALITSPAAAVAEYCDQ